MSSHLARPGAVHHIVTSNHDQAVEGWLRDTRAFHDPANMRTWLDLNALCARGREQGEHPRPFWTLMKRYLPKNYRWNIVHEDDSLIVAGIEHGLHGHLEPHRAIRG